MVRRAATILLTLLGLTGCATMGSMFGGKTEVEVLEMSATPPGQVAVYLKAEAGGEPLSELTESSFAIYEDGTLVSASQSKQTLLDPALVSRSHTLLLLDLGGEAQTPENRTALARATGTFVDTVRKSQPVAVYAFDGSESPVQLVTFERATDAPPLGAVPEVEHFTPRDDSRDLYGSVITALKELNTQLMADAAPISLGTLVVFTQGPDLTGRVEVEDYYANIDASKRDIVVIHLGEAKNELTRLGRNGLLPLDVLANAGPVFEGAAFRVRALEGRHYLLSYCSPSRGTKRQLRIEVTGQDGEGHERKGNVELELDTAGFGPGCDAHASPPMGKAATDAAPTNPGGTTPSAAAAGEPSVPVPADDAGGEGSGGIVPPPEHPGYGD